MRPSCASEPAGKMPGSSQSNHLPKRYTSEPSGKPPGPPRTIYRSDIRGSRWTRCRARLIQRIRQSATSEPSGNTLGPSRSEPSAEAIHERSVEQAVAAEPRAIRHASRSQRVPQISNRTPLIIRCESLNGGRAWKDCHGGCYSCIITECRRRPRAPHLLRDYQET